MKFEPYRKTILILSANSRGTSQLRLDEEVREIKEGLLRSRQRANFTIITALAVRYRDIQRAILDNDPQIVHFSGHGAGEEGLVFEDETGQVKLVGVSALAGLFELFAEQVECVVLDACYSKVQAEAIAQHIPYVVGMNQAIGDKAAIEFSVGFYDALGADKDYVFAYKLGCTSIRLAGISEKLAPILIEKRSAPKLEKYDQALKQYEQEFSSLVLQKRHSISEASSQLQQLRSVLRKQDVESIENRIEDTWEISLAVQDRRILNTERLAQAIMRRIGASDSNSISSFPFPDGSLWEMNLPETGLQLPTQKAIFYLSQETDSTLLHLLNQLVQEKDGAFLILASIADVFPHGLTPLQVIWLSPSSLREMISIPEKDLLIWLAKFMFGQINVVALPGMLPYKTKGITQLFFGREYELASLTSGRTRGGIIIGAHRSGKTSFLYKLKDRLQQRGNKVIGPITFFEFQSFFQETLESLGDYFSIGMSLEDWSSALKAYCKNKQESHLVFLFDEVDRMIQEDLKSGSNLGQKMRALQNEGYCQFFLAGHAKLREAITIEFGPFYNFAEEITFTGLTKEAATELIQKPMKLLGFEVSDTQANRIYEGTAGVAVLIQEFCLKLLDELRLSGASEISDTTIEEVEQSPDFLDIVFEHYRYSQTWDSMAITLLIGMKGESKRRDITEVFKEHGIILSRDQLDKALDFLKQFGVLQKLRNSHFRILSDYLTDAIKTNDPDSLLESELNKGRAI